MRRVACRAILYHVAAVFVLGLNVSANDPILKHIATQSFSSPFVLMIERAGITSLKHIVNAVTLIASLCAANTRLYVSVHTGLWVSLMAESNSFRLGTRGPSI